MSNKLSGEISPYLQQHANNPVDWWPWSDKALQRARKANKPILLSIGYSACHWCHVMAQESFEDPETAELMNRLFINIKVDREERPDLDQIYQAAHLLLTHRNGGWPLTLALTPAGIPFFAGTYFPKAASGGRPAFSDVLRQLADSYAEHQEHLREIGPSVIEAISRSIAAPGEASHQSEIDIREACIASLLEHHDRRFGGFQGSVKFPHPAKLALLNRAADSLQNEEAASAVRLSLRRMANGGLYDHLGGGFSRYCIDERWLTPHFEKMLCDNALLLELYTHQWASSRDEQFKRVTNETAHWLMREMQSEEGCFHAAIDADSGGFEGRYYLWHKHEVEQLLHTEQLALFMAHYGLNEAPNFEQRLWHLRVSQPLDEIAHALDLPPHTAQIHLDEARRKLFAVRSKRPAPAHDDKILVAWNAMAITALAHAATRLHQPEFLHAAQRAMDFIRQHLWQAPHLLTAWRNGRARTPAYLDDHAALIQACLALLAAEYRQQDLDFAHQLAERLLSHFEDPQHGGFYFTASDVETSLLRFKPWHDGATPSGNGLAAQSLIWLGHLSGDTRYLDAATRCLKCFQPQMQAHPAAASSLVLALDDMLSPPQIVVIAGGSAAEQSHWQQQILALPGNSRRLVLVAPAQSETQPASLRLPAHTTIAAQVCQHPQCMPPFNTLEALCKALRSREG